MSDFRPLAAIDQVKSLKIALSGEGDQVLLAFIIDENRSFLSDPCPLLRSTQNNEKR